MLERCFELAAARRHAGRRDPGGLTTFMVMAYIIFVNPAILSFALPLIQRLLPLR